MTPPADPPAADPSAPPAAPVQEADSRLSPAELLALQLLARGYSSEEIAALRGVHPVAVLNDLGRAVAVLGAANARAAADEARRRGLIV